MGKVFLMGITLHDVDMIYEIDHGSYKLTCPSLLTALPSSLSLLLRGFFFCPCLFLYKISDVCQFLRTLLATNCTAVLTIFRSWM